MDLFADFGIIFIASGTLNFFFEGWPFHKFYRHIPGFDFSGSIKKSKTSTLDRRPGNMPLDQDLQPTETKPKCIYVDILNGITLNAVGLSGPGFEHLLNQNVWQNISEPFGISIMAVGCNRKVRIMEIKRMVVLLKRELPRFKAPIFVELNIHCPNTSHDPRELTEDALPLLEACSPLGIPLILKINALTPIRSVQAIADSKLADALCVSSTIPFGELPERIPWKKLFAKGISPLTKRNLSPGGLSGPIILPIVLDYIERLRTADIQMNIIGGGGIFHPRDVRKMKRVGANAIEIGTVAIHRPWRVRAIIQEANKQFGGKS